MRPYGGFWQEQDLAFYCWMHRSRKQQHDVFVKWFEEQSGIRSVCEIGCGFGVFYPVFFAEKGVEYTGIDLAARAIEHCRAVRPGQFWEADATDWHPREPLFDLVFSQGTIDNTPDMDEFLRAHLRLSLRLIYLTAYRGYFPKLKKHTRQYHPGHQCYYNDLSPSRAARVLEEEGCKDILIHPLNGETAIVGERVWIPKTGFSSLSRRPEAPARP